MPSKDFFPQRSGLHPMVFASPEINQQYKGLLKIGYTSKAVQSAFNKSVGHPINPGGGGDD